MPVLDRLRDITLDTLARQYAAERLTLGTFEHRIDAAFRATSPCALADLTWDLPPLSPARWRDLYDAAMRPWRAPGCRRIDFRMVPRLVVALDGEPRTWLVGRRSSSDVVLGDPLVSREHALLSVRGGRCSVRDLSSTNRTWLNGRPVAAAVVRPGDTLMFGPVEALVC